MIIPNFEAEIEQKRRIEQDQIKYKGHRVTQCSIVLTNTTKKMQFLNVIVTKVKLTPFISLYCSMNAKERN